MWCRYAGREEVISIILKILIFIGIPLLGLIVGISRSNSRDRERKLRRGYLDAKEDVLKALEENRKKVIEEQKLEISYALQQASNEAALKKAALDEQVQRLADDLVAARARRDEKLKELAANFAKEIEEKSKEGALQLQSVADFYDQQRVNVSEEYAAFKAEMETKLNAIRKEVQAAEAKQAEIIEEYKRAEKIKEDRNFFRIVLSETDRDDVKKLRKYADELHNPTALYKLIYKEYYERPFNEMVGRVVTGRGNTGIYKITNLENGKVYIGQTKQAFKERWRTHLKRGVKAEPGTQNKLYAAMWEEGAENFTFEVLAECDTTELNAKEKEYIAFYHANTWGYNSTGGNS